MGENTPESVEIRCPGCRTRFRLTPKKGRLPTGDIPCPRCSEIISAAESLVSPTGADDASLLDDDSDGQESSVPAFGVTSLTRKVRRRSDTPASSTLQDKEKEAVARLKKLSQQQGAGTNQTIAGLPGVVDDGPSPEGGSSAKSTLDRLSADRFSDLPRSKPGASTESASNREATKKQRVEPRVTQETAENPSIPPEEKKRSESPTTSESLDPGVLARIEKKKITKEEISASKFAREPTRRASSLESRTSPSLSLSKLRSAAEVSESAESTSSSKEKLSLAARFKKARQQGGVGVSDLRAKLRKVNSATKDATTEEQALQELGEPQDDIEIETGVDISEGELEVIVEQTASDAGLPAPKLTSPMTPLPKRDQPASPPEATVDDHEKPDNPDHSGLFESFPSPPETTDVVEEDIGEVSKKAGSTSQSMLARLQKRRTRGDNVDPLEVGAASEQRGSGYIRLPTTEIQEVLGHGDFRLKIQGVIYEPVDRDGLTQLIKGGVLMGAEELAEGEDDWMPVSEHPVFGELRRKMATEAHQVLSRMGATQRNQVLSPPLADEADSPELPGVPKIPEATSTPPLPDTPLEDSNDQDESVEESADDLSPEDPQEEEISAISEPEPPEPAPVEKIPAPVATPALNDPAPIAAAPKKKKKSAIYALLLIAVLAAAGGFVVLTEPGQNLVAGLTEESPSTPDEDVQKEVDPAIQEAVEVALSTVIEALPDAFSDPSRADQWAQEQISDSDFDNVGDLLDTQWKEGRREEDFVLLFFGVLMENESFQMARRVALTGMELFPGNNEFVGAHRRSINADESLLSYQPVHLVDFAEYSVESVYEASGHRGVLLNSEGDKHQLLFKPERTGRESSWRSEVAAWRFCELVICHFEILKVEPAIMTRDFFEELSGESEVLASLAGEANWNQVEIDGESVDAVWGSLEYIPDEPTSAFPIEYRRLWLNWLAAGTPTDDLEVELSAHLESIRDLADGRFYQGLVSQVGGLATADIARQVSSLLLFDFLTNNWERFFTRDEDYGTNNPVIGNVLVSRNNGDAFQPRASRRVQGRFEWTTRFSSSTVSSIRALDRDIASGVLFPEASAMERNRLSVMWTQRGELLDRVDELSARHGTEEVLHFP